jgi:hypothetical protein
MMAQNIAAKHIRVGDAIRTGGDGTAIVTDIYAHADLRRLIICASSGRFERVWNVWPDDTLPIEARAAGES